MHIPDGFLSLPVVVTTDSLGSVGFLLSLKKMKLRVEKIPRIGISGALLFALQTFSFPIIGGTSAHFLVVPFITLYLGLSEAIFLSGITIALQALLLSHGGVLTWGANFLNMGLIPAISTNFLYRLLSRTIWRKVAILLAVFVSISLSASFASVELGLSRTLPFPHTLYLMLAVYIPLGLLEGVLTVGILEVLGHGSKN